MQTQVQQYMADRRYIRAHGDAMDVYTDIMYTYNKARKELARAQAWKWTATREKQLARLDAQYATACLPYADIAAEYTKACRRVNQFRQAQYGYAWGIPSRRAYAANKAKYLAS